MNKICVNYQAIISQFQGNLNMGLSALFEGYGQVLYGFAVNHWHLNEDEGYDVLYKTLETVGKVINRYEFSSESHFTNWLFKIHKNNILQLIRAKKIKESGLTIVNYSDWEREVKQLEDDAFGIEQFKSTIDELSNINAFDDAPINNHLMTAMQKALMQLSDTERELLLLRMNNYSYDDIAKMLGIENKQLKVKFNRAKAKVQKKTLEILKESNNETK